ncbi:class I SAM-dependent methyltransferase [Pseudonocardia acaciae]|uniref:class I SAM-dependent methyltransferase n=1 Tax=Pseudonocardia acaciae TaxID=551276 RepID=UPI00048F172F|nr:class I SAM-dependent methyltransferase [Pseudonocardia acaciae]
MTAPWQFAEFSPVGVDLSSTDAVRAYDRNQGTDPARDRALLDRLGVGPGTRLVDLACGTGSFVVEAARRGARAHGVDVSTEMLAFAGRRAEDAGVEVSLSHAGFLTYRHDGAPADVVTTKSALHQLPDFWKQAALLNIAGYLAPGGLLYIWDVIFTFPPEEYAGHLRRLVDEFGHTDGEGFSREDFESHLREEFSTYGWILEGMLDRAGFDIVSTDFPRPTHGEFLCRRR